MKIILLVLAMLCISVTVFAEDVLVRPYALIKNYLDTEMFEYDSNSDIQRADTLVCYDPNWEFDSNNDVQPRLLFWSRNDENDIQVNPL